MSDVFDLRCGDCLELMRTLKDKSVDLIVTDPPYEFETTRGCGCFGSSNRTCHGELKGLDKGITDEYLEEMYRVMKVPNIYIWCNKNQIPQYLNFFIGKGCAFDILTWHKSNPIPACGNKYLSDTEYCLFFRKGAHVYGSYDTKHKYWVTTINKADKERYNHPTIKPLDIISMLVTNSSRGGGSSIGSVHGLGNNGGRMQGDIS